MRFVETPIIVLWLKAKARCYENIAGFHQLRAINYQHIALQAFGKNDGPKFLRWKRRQNKAMDAVIRNMRRCNDSLEQAVVVLQEQVDYEKRR